MKRATCFAVLVSFSSLLTIHAQLLNGPFVEGSGHWTIVPNGDFKSGTSNWVDRCSDLGVLRPAKSGGAESLIIKAGKGNGFAIAQSIPVIPGQAYVLSGFLLTAGLSGHFYLDLDDVPFEVHDGRQGGIGGWPDFPEWQFVWAPFTVPVGVTSVTVRVVHDHMFPFGDHGYADQIAVTPISEFMAPQTVAQSNR